MPDTKSNNLIEKMWEALDPEQAEEVVPLPQKKAFRSEMMPSDPPVSPHQESPIKVAAMEAMGYFSKEPNPSRK